MYNLFEPICFSSFQYILYIQYNLLLLQLIL